LLKRNFAYAGSLLLAGFALMPARTLPTGCATERAGWRTATALHNNSVRQRARQRSLLSTVQRTAGTAYDWGQIAVMDDSGGVLVERNPFSLSGRKVTLTPVPGGYTYATATAEWDTTADDSGQTLSGLGDDDARDFNLPFNFLFYNKEYKSFFIQSDGNLSFTTADSATAARSLGRLAAGPPRIAPLFTDLDPTQTGGDVRVYSAADRMVITWHAVRLYDDYGAGARQSFQVTLYATGLITFNYNQISATESVVGISPGNLTGDLELATFDDASTQVYSSTLAERFSASESIDIVRTAQRFYETHEDAYDYLVIFNTSGIAAASGALAYETTVRTLVQGIGDTAVDLGSTFGSGRRLEAVLNMGPLSQYPVNPYSTVGARGLITGDTTMSLLGHEAGHLYLALASVRDPNDPTARPMLGNQLAHWSFNFNSEASLLEGNRITDYGEDQTPRFVTTGTVEGYSALDQYLMGFRSADEVPPTFLVSGSVISNSAFPRTGVTLRGARRDIAMDELIAAEGRRVPDDTVSQRLYRFGFILVSPAGTPPTTAQLQQLEQYRTEFEPYFHQAAGERAWADATQRRVLNVSLWPAAGAVAGWPVTATVSIAQARDTDLNVRLIGAAGEATIPAGATSTALTFTQPTAGTSDVYVVPSVDGYETVHVRVDAKETREPLKVEIYYQEPGLTVLRVSDVNEIPYPNIPLVLSSQETPGASDVRGLVWIWRSDDAPFTAQVEGIDGSRIAVP